MNIEELKGCLPVVCRPYKTTSSDMHVIAEIVADWKKHGIVTESRSPYASPVLLVSQEDGKSRLVINYRRLHQQTKRQRFPLPSMDEQLESLRNDRLFVKLDLANGYFQIPLSDTTREITAFITPDETGELTRTPFGLAGAPNEFQTLMNKVLEPLRGTLVKSYLDDWVIEASN